MADSDEFQFIIEEEEEATFQAAEVSKWKIVALAALFLIIASFGFFYSQWQSSNSKDKAKVAASEENPTVDSQSDTTNSSDRLDGLLDRTTSSLSVETTENETTSTSEN